MAKVLIISSSPRKNGNTDLLAKEFEKGALEAGHEVEYVSLTGKKIGYCLACNYCHEHGNVCVQKDDMAEIIAKMKKADVYVLATPVYFLSVCAQMKTFIDRTYSAFMELKGKRLYYLISCTDFGETSAEGAKRALEGFRYCLPYAECEGYIYALGNGNHGDVMNKPELEKAYRMGRSVTDE